ncbi:MAG: hypothetical protein AAF570_17095 [Bacteroidota bacterium]
MKTIQSYLLLLLVLIVTVSACKKEDLVDYRTDFLGEFQLTNTRTWLGNSNEPTGTFQSVGTVRLYAETDASLNLPYDEEADAIETKIIIEIDNPAQTIFTVLNEDGCFSEEMDPYYEQSGYLNATKDSLFITRVERFTSSQLNQGIVGVRK